MVFEKLEKILFSKQKTRSVFTENDLMIYCINRKRVEFQIITKTYKECDAHKKRDKYFVNN